MIHNTPLLSGWSHKNGNMSQHPMQQYMTEVNPKPPKYQVDHIHLNHSYIILIAGVTPSANDIMYKEVDGAAKKKIQTTAVLAVHELLDVCTFIEIILHDDFIPPAQRLLPCGGLLWPAVVWLPKLGRRSLGQKTVQGRVWWHINSIVNILTQSLEGDHHPIK